MSLNVNLSAIFSKVLLVPVVLLCDLLIFPCSWDEIGDWELEIGDWKIERLENWKNERKIA
jgi:hypothetical protein